MQSFQDIPENTTLVNSRTPLLNNILTALSSSSGTAFPTANLQVGMLCFRTDQNKLYQLKDATPTWYLLLDLSGAGALVATATACSGNAATATTAAACSGNAASATTAAACSGNAASATTAASCTGNAATSTTAATANAINTANNYQGNSLGIGTTPSATAGEIRATNNITAYYSDARLKDVLGVIENALDSVCSLSGVRYVNNSEARLYGYDNTEEQVGVLAQEVARVLPQVVTAAPFDIGQHEDGTEFSLSGKNYLTVRYERLVPLLIEAIKELRDEIELLKAH